MFEYQDIHILLFPTNDENATLSWTQRLPAHLLLHGAIHDALSERDKGLQLPHGHKKRKHVFNQDVSVIRLVPTPVEQEPELQDADSSGRDCP